ncbi:MAG: NAD-dependent protein deacylase [Bacilli bacterium]|nr:NAD-dependent protein deacylase [Bacilli bacterium]
MDKEALDRCRKAIAEAKTIVFLGGAGVSTGSGIPDFRSPQGLYNVRSEYGVEYETILSHSFFETYPDVFYDFYWKHMVAEKAKPNRAHLALANFEQKHHNLTIVTQNIDGLHQDAGSVHVLEAHGSVRRYHCQKCGKPYALDQIPHHGVPHCSCGGQIKPDVVLYEEPLDAATLEEAVQRVRFANVLIIGGTSMRVYPIAALPQYFNLGTQIIINAEPTPYDRYCDYVFHEDIGATLEALLED